MNLNHCFLLAFFFCAALAVSAAETNPAAPAKINGPAATEEKAKTTAKAAPQKKAATPAKLKVADKSEPLAIPEPAIAKQNHINVRGQALINSEIVTHLEKGEQVMVLEEITLGKPKQ